MKYKCTNPSCDAYDYPIEVSKVTLVLHKGKLVSKLHCEACGSPMEDVTEREHHDFTGVNFGKFRGLNNEQKQEVLKKRTRRHYQTHIKEEAEFKVEEAKKQFKELGKR